MDSYSPDQSALLSSLSAAMCISEFNLDGEIIHVNRNFLTMSGYTQEQLLHQNHRIFCPAEYAVSRQYTLFWRALVNGRRLSGRFMRKHRDGSEFWMEGAYMPIRDSEGKVERILAVGIDCSHRARVTIEQKASLNAITRSMLLAEFTPDGHIITANENFLACFGYSAKEIKGQLHRLLCPVTMGESPDYKEFWGQLRDGNFIARTVERITRDGRRLWLDAHYNPVFNAEKKITRIIKLSTDVTWRVEQEEQQLHSLRQLAVMPDAADAPVLILDRNWRTLYSNESFTHMFGYTHEELHNQSPHVIFGPDGSDEVVAKARAQLDQGHSFTSEFLAYTKHGRRLWAKLVVSEVREAGEFLHQVICVFTDITGTKMQQVLQQKIITAMGHELALVEVMALMCHEMREIAPELCVCVIGVTDQQEPFHICSPDMPENFASAMRDVHSGFVHWMIQTGESVTETNCRARGDHDPWARLLADSGVQSCYAVTVQSGASPVRGIVLFCYKDQRGPDRLHLRIMRVLAPLTALALEKEKSRVEVRKLAYYDTLTGLPNRHLLMARAEQLITGYEHDKKPAAVLCINIDRFAQLNESFGRDAGDQLLRDISLRLGDKVGKGNLVGRVGDDEFMVVMHDCSVEKAQQVAERLQHYLHAPYDIHGVTLHYSISIGISVYPENGQTMAELMHCAQLAMHQAKRAGRGQYLFFSDELNTLARERVTLEASLHDSLKNNEIRLLYQPQIELQKDGLFGVEALSRWHSADFGHVPPDRFIPLAEDSGFINTLSRWVLKEACEQLARWRQSGLFIPTISVNLSPTDFHSADLPEYALAVLRENTLTPKDLILEITEGVLLDGNADTMRTIHAVAATGIELSMDDFGTGYSSLSYLRNLPISELKLDKSFMADIETDEASRRLSKAVLGIGTSLHLKVVAEGVETIEQQEVLRMQGYHIAQGYLHSRPLPPDDFARWFLEFERKKAIRLSLLEDSAFLK